MKFLRQTRVPVVFVILGCAATLSAAAFAQTGNANVNAPAPREIRRVPRDHPGRGQPAQPTERKPAAPKPPAEQPTAVQPTPGQPAAVQPGAVPPGTTARDNAQDEQRARVRRGGDQERDGQRDGQRMRGRDRDDDNGDDEDRIRVRRGIQPGEGGERREIRRRGDTRNDRLFERRGARANVRVNSVPARTVVQRGTVVRELPREHQRVTVRDRTYFRSGDVYYTDVRSGPNVEYRVIAPPVGVHVSYISERAEPIVYGGVRYYRYDGAYYLPSLHEGRTRYVVVEPPIGAEFHDLPEGGEWFTGHNGERLWRIGEMFFRALARDGRNSYVRVHYVQPSPTVVYGTLAYRGRLALPSDAVATIQLVDMRQGPQGAVVAEQTIQSPGPPPIPYTIRFDGGRVTQGQQYGLAAAITANGRILYATLRPQPFAVGGNSNSIDLELDPARDQPEPQAARVTGRLVITERTALPNNAEVVVRLIDVNNPSGGEVVVAEQVFYPPGGGAIPFELRYDPSDIDPLGIFIVEARIRVGDNAIFYNAEEQRVITRGYPDELEIVLSPIR